MTREDLIAKARSEGKWLRTFYQDMCFTPDELERANTGGSMRWSAESFELIAPAERVAQLERDAARAAARAETARRKASAME